MGQAISRPALIGLYRAVRLGTDRVAVCNAQRSVVLTAPGHGDALMALLGALDGTASIDQLTERFPGLRVPALLQTLGTSGVLMDAASAPGHHVPTATALHASSAAPAAGPRRLHDATVVLAGCGPVAATTAVVLAKAGIGRLVLADEHTVSDNDVITSPVFGHDALGQSRALAVAQACTASGDVRIEIADAHVAGALDGATIAIIQARYGDSGMCAPLADTALQARVACVVHWQDALELLISPIIDGGGRPCHRCMEARRLSHVAQIDEHLAYLTHRSRTAPEPDSFLAAHTALSAGLLATRVLRHASGTLPQSERGTAFVIDLAAAEWRREAVLEVPGCTACAPEDER